jgi:hypothetical protein
MMMTAREDDDDGKTSEEDRARAGRPKIYTGRERR